MTNSFPSANTPSDVAPFYSGRWAILAIAATAIGMTTFAWWYWYSIGNRALNYWGTSTAMLIQRAPNVELLEIGPSLGNPSDETVTTANGEPYVIRARGTLTPPAVHGLGHIRASFLRNAAYDWNEPADSCQPEWQYVLRFADGEKRADLWISLDCPRVALLEQVGSPKPLSISPIAERLRPFLEEQFPASTPADAAAEPRP